MSRRASAWLLALIAGIFLTGVSWLYHLRLSGGDSFPVYSSLRADPLGTRAFYEGLAEVPGMAVERWTRPILRLPLDPARTVLLAGMSRTRWAAISTEEARHLDALASAGSRLVVIFAAERSAEIPSSSRYETEEDGAERKRREKEEAKRESELPARLKHAEWGALWGVAVKDRFILDRDQGALRGSSAPRTLPGAVPWKSDLYFAATEPDRWTTLYTRGASPVVVERLRWRGAIVLASDAYFVSNEALTDQRYPTLLAWVAGPHRQVVFVESHLGLEEDIGVAALARRYGLGGCFFVLLLLAALWIWQRMALFVPPPPVADQLSLSYHQTAGLEALLRRALLPAALISSCVKEWKTGARVGDAAKVESALSTLPPGASPVESYNLVVKALHARR